MFFFLSTHSEKSSSRGFEGRLYQGADGLREGADGLREGADGLVLSVF